MRFFRKAYTPINITLTIPLLPTTYFLNLPVDSTHHQANIYRLFFFANRLISPERSRQDPSSAKTTRNPTKKIHSTTHTRLIPISTHTTLDISQQSLERLLGCGGDQWPLTVDIRGGPGLQERRY